MKKRSLISFGLFTAAAAFMLATVEPTWGGEPCAQLDQERAGTSPQSLGTPDNHALLSLERLMQNSCDEVDQTLLRVTPNQQAELCQSAGIQTQATDPRLSCILGVRLKQFRSELGRFFSASGFQDDGGGHRFSGQEIQSLFTGLAGGCRTQASLAEKWQCLQRAFEKQTRALQAVEADLRSKPASPVAACEAFSKAGIATETAEWIGRIAQHRQRPARLAAKDYPAYLDCRPYDLGYLLKGCPGILATKTGPALSETGWKCLQAGLHRVAGETTNPLRDRLNALRQQAITLSVLWGKCSAQSDANCSSQELSSIRENALAWWKKKQAEEWKKTRAAITRTRTDDCNEESPSGTQKPSRFLAELEQATAELKRKLTQPLPPPSIPPAGLKEADRQKVAGAQYRTPEQLLEAAKTELQKWKAKEKTGTDFTQFFLETEMNDTTPKSSQEHYQELLARWLSMKASYLDLIQKLRKEGREPDRIREEFLTRLNEDFLKDYRSHRARISDFLAGHGGNCEAESKFVYTVLRETDLLPSGDETFAFQVFNDHVQPVLWNSKTRRVWVLHTGEQYAGLIAPLYHPELLFHAYIRTHQPSEASVDTSEFLIAGLTPQEAALAHSRTHRGSYGSFSNTNLRFPNTGVFYGEDQPPEAATIVSSRRSATVKSAADFKPAPGLRPSIQPFSATSERSTSNLEDADETPGPGFAPSMGFGFDYAALLSSQKELLKEHGGWKFVATGPRIVF